MPRLTENQRNQALGHLQAGASVTDVALRFNVQRNTIYALQRRYLATGSTGDHFRSGRPRVTTAAQDRFMRISHLRNRFQTAQRTAETLPGGPRISSRTVRRRLADAGIRAYRAAQRIRLQPRHVQARLHWAQHHARWTRNQWAQVLFSDESRFVLDRHDGRMRVYRRHGERYHAVCVHEAARQGGGSVMVWAGIAANVHTPLVFIRGNLTAVRYVDEVLRPHLIPFLQQHGPLIFMQDNAPAHRARVTDVFLQAANVNRLVPWPAMSPDLNPLEHLWDALDRDIRHLPDPVQNVQRLANALQAAWHNIPQQTMRRLILSMRRRCNAVIAARGHHTRY